MTTTATQAAPATEANGTPTAAKQKVDPRLKNVQLSKQTVRTANVIAARTDFDRKFVIDAAVQVFAETVDPEQQTDLIYAAKKRYTTFAPETADGE